MPQYPGMTTLRTIIACLLASLLLSCAEHNTVRTPVPPEPKKLVSNAGGGGLNADTDAHAAS